VDLAEEGFSTKEPLDFKIFPVLPPDTSCEGSKGAVSSVPPMPLRVPSSVADTLSSFPNSIEPSVAEDFFFFAAGSDDRADVSFWLRFLSDAEASVAPFLRFLLDFLLDEADLLGSLRK